MTNREEPVSGRPAARRALTAGAVVVALAVAGLVVALVQVHAATADWWPSAIPTRVQYDGRNFTCGGGGEQAGRAEAAGLEARGHTIGGGTILAPPGTELPAQIVVSADGRLQPCSLSGGP